MSTKLYLLFTVVKDNKKCTYQYRVKLSLPFSLMNYSGRAREVKKSDQSLWAMTDTSTQQSLKGFPFVLFQDLVIVLEFKKGG